MPESVQGAPVLSVDEVVRLEQAIAEAGTPLWALMRRAGTAVARKAQELAPWGSSVSVLAGSGNNGGDGWVAAELLAEFGYRVTLLSTRAAEELRAEPLRQTALEIKAELGARPTSLEVLEAPLLGEVYAALFSADVVIDALLGTGFSGSELREPVASWIRALGEAQLKGALKVLAADVPSGLSAQEGTAAAPCVRADATVTMLALKPGLLAEGAREYVGELFCDPLGVEVSAFL